MGLMKKVRTAKSFGPKTLPDGAADIIRLDFKIRRAEADERYRKDNEGHSAIESFMWPVDYVGKAPTEHGLYLVVDLLADSCSAVSVHGDGKAMIAEPLGSRSTLIEYYNQEYYRWFRVRKPEKQDYRDFARLPVVQLLRETAHECHAEDGASGPDAEGDW